MSTKRAQEIANMIEGIKTQSAISEIIGKLKKLNSAIKNDFYVKRKSIDEIMIHSVFTTTMKY
jgi:hypothetical protein